MLKWFSGEEAESGSVGPGSSPAAAPGETAVEEMAERLTHTERLVAQLKEMIREKDAVLCSKDDQLKAEKEASEAKLSKLRLQNKAKVTSLTIQLEELRRQQGGPDTPTRSKKGSSEGADQASRGKIVLLKKKVEELEQQLAQRVEELDNKRKEVESQRLRGEEMDAMLIERDRKLTEKEAYIVHLQTALSGDQSFTPAPAQTSEASGAVQELQLLVQSLTRKVGESEERYSLLQEQSESLKELLVTEKEQYTRKEIMYKENIQTFKDIIIQKDNQLMEVSQMHEQELFKLAAKSDASADLEQLLKALKQKLHEKEEVLLGKTQVINVLQGEVDGRDQQIKDLMERLRRLQVERESLEAKMEAEKHVMRAQLRDMMEKQRAEIQRLSEQHQAQLAQTQQELLGQMEELRRATVAAPSTSREASGSERAPVDAASVQRIAELEAQAKQKTEDASRSEAKFLKMKAWSKSRIRQLEEELKKIQAGDAHLDLISLQSRITALEEEREENLCKLEQYDELQAKNEMLQAKLAAYEEQQRTLQADLEQFTKRAASQASESGSADDAQSQVLEWQEMVAEAATARERAKEEKAAMALRISHMEEEREELIEDDWFFPGCSDSALETRQQELEEELAQARGLGQHRAKKPAAPSQRSLQEDFEFDGQSQFQDPRSTSESTTPMEGENMGDGLRSVVEELELERNQLQEQILSLEERCQDLEDRLQLQARVETLQVTFDVDEDEQPFWVSQNELEKLQSQLASVRHQQSRDAEKHQLLVTSLNEQLQGLSDMQESLESSLVEKENTLAKTSEKLELVSSLRESLSLKETQFKEVSDKLLQTEQSLENISQKCSGSEKQCGELKSEVTDLTQKLSLLKEKTQKQEVTIDTLQTEVDQTNEELDKLNTAYLEERAQLIHDLQSCEREIDSLKDVLLEKDKEISVLSGNISEYTEQLIALKQDLKMKEDNLIQVENALSKAEREVSILRESQNSDQRTLENKITELMENLKDTEMELLKARDLRDSKTAEVETLVKQADDDKKAIQELRGEIQKQLQSHCHHLSECEMHIASLKEQLMSSAQKLQEALELQQQFSNKEQSFEKELKSSKDEQNRLCSQVEKYRNEMHVVSQQLEEQTRTEDIIRGEMKEKEQIIASLEIQLKEAGAQVEEERQRFEDALKTRDSEREKMSSDLQSKSENISNLQNLLNSLKNEKKQLQENLEALTGEFEMQKQNVHQLKEQVTSALDSNASYQNQVQQLSAEAARLQQELSDSQITISELRCEKESLRDEVSVLERQVSQNSTVIEALQKDKEELTLQNSELSRVMEQSSHSSSEILLEKTNECNRLQRSLREEGEKVAQLQGRVQSLTSKVDQLQSDVAGKDGTLGNLQMTMEAQQKRLMQLQEEESSLKSQLREKEEVWKENQCLKSEASNHKITVCSLQAEAESLREQHSQVCQQIKNGEETLRNVKHQCQKHKEELNVTNETIKSLTEQIGVLEGNARELESDAELRRGEVVKLQSHIQAATEENHQLRAACESKEKELAHHSQVLLDLNGQLEKALEQNSSFSATVNILTENNQRLQEELAQKEKAVSELNADKSSLQELLSGLEKQISEDRQAIDRLLKEKEELATAADGFKKVLQESEQSNSAGLLQKTNECEALSKVLKEKEGWLQNLREEADGLKKQVAELTEMFTQKEQTALAQRSQLEDKQNELLQLHDAIRVLQEQESVLRSGIMEKDALIQQGAEERQVYQREISREKSVVSQLQAELETVRGDCAEAQLQLQQREEEFQMSRDELNKQTQSVVLLSSQLGEANERAREMEVRVQKLADEHRLLTRELEQRNAEATDLTDDAQALKEQSAAFKSELQKTVTALARSQEEVTRLKTECSGLERLQGILQEKDEALRQKDTLVQQLNDSMAELDKMLKQKTDDAVGQSAKISDLEDSVCRLRDQVDSSGLEVSTLQHSLKQKEELSLEWQSQSAAAVQTLGTNLQAKEVECSSLKEKVFHLEESVEKLNNTLQAQTSEVEDLKRVLGQKDVALSDQFKCLQDVQRRADEALLFKTQFTESAELVSQLQSQLHSLSTDSEHLKKSAEETQSAFNNLREKYAANLEELQDARRQLSQRMDEVSGLQKLLDDSARQRERASSTTETLRSELSAVCQKLEEAEDLNAKLSKEKDEALVSHQANVSLLTVEIEKLKSQYLQVATQLNVLTENLEQREMALHAINSQYSLQNKNTSQLVSEMQKLEEVNQRLKEEIALSKEENRKLLTAVSCENAHLKEEFSKSLAEKKELENRCHQMRLQMEEECSSLKEMMERVTSERDGIQTKVSVQDQELCQLKENLQKVEQVLQDSEREWLFVLDREKQEKNLLVEQLKSVENEMKSKDIKVDALKQDLDGLQEKLALASSAIRQGSDQLSAKELEASVSRVQLEKVLASVQEKEFENSRLKEALNAAQHQLHALLQKRGFSICAPGERSPALSDEQVSLQNMITRLEASHQGEVDTLNSDLNQTVAHLKRTEQMLHEGERCSDEKDHQTALLQTKVEQLQSQLSAEVERAKDAAVTLSCLNSELREKGDQIGRMNIQISQQLLLLADLSQQLLDKDASIAQVMESAANERIKTREENSAVVGQLQSLEQEHATSAKRFEEISQQLHEQLSRLQAELEAATSQKSDLIQEKDALTSQLVTATKEKDATKRKLQAALLVRKELLRKVEQYEAQTEENAEVLRLQEQLKEAADQARAAAERHEQHISDLRKGNLETEGQITEQKAQSERLQSEKQLLESTLNEKEQRLSQTLQTLTEKSFLLEQLQAGAAEKDAAAEQERKDWMQKLEQLQKEIQNASSTASAAVEEAEKELAQVTHEKTKLEKKVHAALLARKETTKKAHEREKKLTQELTELKEEYQALLEQQRQQTNDLNALQFNFEKKVKEVEELNKTSLSDQDELASLKQLMQERDKSLQDLKKTMGEREIQSQSLPNLQMELENLKSQIGKMYEELASKDEALTVGEQGAEALKSKLLTAEKHLEEAQAEIKEKTDQAEERRDALKAFELRVQQEKHVLISEKDALESRLNLLESALQHHTETAAALEETRLQCAEKQRSLDVLKREQAEATALISELKDEISSANKKLAEFAKDKTCAVCKTRRDDQDGPCFSCQRHENLQIKLKEREEAFLMSKAQLSEKEELIAALELQLQQQIGAHEASMERVKTEAAELQRSQHNGTVNDQDNQSKIAALTRKLQAALLSRKELIKENSALKQDVKRQADKERAKELEFSSLEAALEEIKRQNMELESSASSASRDKDRLRGEVDQLLSDNHSLSAACDSLKLTIENITQQKEAFSCQLESLKDSQTDELSKWKSKHAELKQEYESLLQSYENISSEMEKMRQVLEATKRDQQEAIKKAHHLEAERDVLEKQVAKLEEEQEGIKEKMRKFSKEKLCKVEELEEENRNTRRELTELTENHRTEVSELTDRNRQLEAEICKLKASSEELDEKLSELHSENKEMAAKLEEATYTLEKASTESKTYTSSVQLKLDEALGLSNSLTAQMETQTSELGAQMEVNNSLQKEKQSLCQQLEKMQNDHELQLGKKDVVIQELRDVISGHSQETVSLNEKVRILEDDKSLLQEELENVQEISDKVKNENEYLETVALRNSEKIDELTESIALLQAQKMELSSQLAATKDMNNQVRQEKEEEQLRLVREFEGKLKTVQRGNEGSKNVNKELQELLKEKHQEINQLQQNCIRYQEVILELESSSKSSQAVAEELKRELKKSSEELSALQQKCGRAEAELSVQRDLLLQAKEKLLSVESERDQMASHVSQSSRRPDNQVLQETQPVQKTDSHVHKEFVFQQQIEELILSKDGESKKVDELKRQLDSKDGEMNALKRAMKTNEAKLSALSSSPGGAEASSLWNHLYQKALNEKDNQLLEQGFVIKRFLEDMRVKDKEMNDLRVTHLKLERTINEYSVAAAAQQRQLFVLSADNAELSESAELMAAQVKDLSDHVERLEEDKNVQNRQLSDGEDAVSRMQLKLQHTEKINADAEAQLLLLRSQNDRLQADSERLEGITVHLKTLLQSKDAEIASLLSCRDGQMSGYIQQLQANHRSQAAAYEDRLASLGHRREAAVKELRRLEAKLRHLQVQVDRSSQEREQTAVKMESFKESMASLQSERERLISQQRTLATTGGKDGAASGERLVSKGMKQEIRKLLNQMDDLNSENAMLRAQLVRYREDLNQVLSLKDNQLKVLLQKQQDVIRNLEHQKAAAEKRHRETRLEIQRRGEESGALAAEISQLKDRVATQEAEILTLRNQRSATNEGRVIADLQDAVAVKAAECSHLQQNLLSQRTLTDGLQEQIQLLEKEKKQMSAEAKDKGKSQIDAFGREVEGMRRERETAEQRAAELAKDQLQLQQKLSESDTRSRNTRLQNESLCKAMAALQDDRDQLIEDFKTLRNRYDEELRETRAALNKVERSLQDASSDLAMLAKQRDVLLLKINALESKDSHAELNKLLDQLSKALSEKERDLTQAVLENSAHSRQLAAFSRSMGSLQDERDRLMEELSKAKRAVDTRQGSNVEASTGVKRCEGIGVNGVQSEAKTRLHTKESAQTLQKSQSLGASDRDVSDVEVKDTGTAQEQLVAGGGSGSEELVGRLQAERVQLHSNLQRCMYEIQQRDQYFQQLNQKLQQAAEEKATVTSQLRVVSQTLRDTQTRCQWLEGQVQGHSQGAAYAEVAPGAPQERSNTPVGEERAEANQLRERLLEVEQSLADERVRRESAEEALRLSEDRVKSLSRDAQRDVSIDMDTEEEWGAASLDPSQPLMAQKVTGGVLACRRWLRGRSLYFSRLLTSRARSRYFFLFYLFFLHVLVFMCLSSAL
eukprot:XP_011608072.1 PREDICTED: golgin subfamily B member 1-like isoform X1 [Takifugu rubripes]